MAELYEIALVGGFVTTLISVVLSFNLFGQHYVKNWTRPTQQRSILKVIFLVPLFALAAYVGLLELDHNLEKFAHGLDMVKECYEAVAIHAFLMLMYDLCGLSPMHVQGKAPVPESIKGRDLHVPFPLSLVYGHAHLDLVWIQRLQRWTLQFVICRPVLSLVDLFLVDLYPSVMSNAVAVLVTVGLNASVTLAFFALVTFYHAFEAELAPFRPLAKFVCIKGVVFFATWQGIILKVLGKVGILHEGYKFSVDEVGEAWHDFLVCLEMGLLFSPLHLYAFPSRDYKQSQVEMKSKKEE